MARRFRGEGRQKVDAKGRVSVPAHFRRAMEEGSDGQRNEVQIVYGDPRRKYLECYTPESFAALEARIDKIEFGSELREALEYHLLTCSHTAEIDADGRLILPQKCRDKAQLDGEALFLAKGDRFEIWNPDIFESEYAEKLRAPIDALPEGRNILSLLANVPEG